MKAVLFFSFFFFIAGPIFPEKLMFSSNSMGMTLEKISDIRQDEFDFILTVEKLPEKEVRVLREKDEEIKRWERIVLPDGLRENFYSSGVLDTVGTYNSRGELLEELLHKDGILDRTRLYIYENNLLSEIIETDADGSVISTSSFTRSTAGRMQRVVQAFPSGEKKISEYIYSAKGIVQEWHGTADKGDLFRFNAGGKTTAEEVWDGDDLKISRRFSYGEGGGYRLIEEDYDKGVTIRKIYDQADNLRRELTTEKGNLVEDILYNYDEEQLMEKVRKIPGIKERWIYQYDTDGEISREEFYKNEILKKITQYTGEDTYHEDLFRKGVPFIRIYFEDERKVREESLNENEYPKTVR